MTRVIKVSNNQTFKISSSWSQVLFLLSYAQQSEKADVDNEILESQAPSNSSRKKKKKNS